jgi:tellurite resistance protein TerC
MHVTVEMWVGTIAILAAIMAVDLLIIGRKPHEPSMKECGLAIGLFSALAVLFGLGVWYFSGPQFAGEFFAGWLTEYSLSIDNLFIFVLIMANLRVPRHLQQFALMVGIVLALVFRGVFIALGAAAIERFSWVFFLFGAFLIYTAAKLYIDYRSEDSEDEEATDNAMLRWVKRVFPSTEQFHGTRLTIVEKGKRLITPMLFVIVALGSTDLLFALDSIPAIYGLTREPYLVFTANVFALMGLRQLYFLIGGLLQRLVYLSVGLSIILGFIGVKLLLHAMHEYHFDSALGFDGELPIWISLTFIVVTLACTTALSLLKSRRDARAELAIESDRVFLPEPGDPIPLTIPVDLDPPLSPDSRE